MVGSLRVNERHGPGSSLTGPAKTAKPKQPEGRRLAHWLSEWTVKDLERVIRGATDTGLAWRVVRPHLSLGHHGTAVVSLLAIERESSALLVGVVRSLAASQPMSAVDASLHDRLQNGKGKG
jgi:hypothetical protein